jgi:hypothetical protein
VNAARRGREADAFRDLRAAGVRSRGFRPLRTSSRYREPRFGGV